MRLHWSILPVIILGVFVGTLLALYVAAKVAQSQIQSATSSNPLLGALGGL